jgi:predicted DNA-binding helix-hairpin-helix protein
MKHEDIHILNRIKELEDNIFRLSKVYSTLIDPIEKDNINNQICGDEMVMNRLTRKLLKNYQYEQEIKQLKTTYNYNNN